MSPLYIRPTRQIIKEPLQTSEKQSLYSVNAYTCKDMAFWYFSVINSFQKHIVLRQDGRLRQLKVKR